MAAPAETRWSDLQPGALIVLGSELYEVLEVKLEDGERVPRWARLLTVRDESTELVLAAVQLLHGWTLVRRAPQPPDCPPETLDG